MPRNYIAADLELGDAPRLGHVWLGDDGQYHATVYLIGSTAFFLDDPKVARAIAAALLEAADGLEKAASQELETTSQPESGNDGDLPPGGVGGGCTL